jgi:hypothetical protein
MSDANSNLEIIGSGPTRRVSTSIYLKAKVSDDDLNKLAKSKLIYIRHPDLHGGSRDVGEKDLSSKFTKAIITGAKCLLGLK